MKTKIIFTLLLISIVSVISIEKSYAQDIKGIDPPNDNNVKKLAPGQTGDPVGNAPGQGGNPQSNAPGQTGDPVGNAPGQLKSPGESDINHIPAWIKNNAGIR